MRLDKKWDVVPPCGMYCGECKACIDGECGGCRSGRGIAADFAPTCSIANCANDRGVKLCIECKDFPCSLIDYFKARDLKESAWYSEVVCNMKEASPKGVDSLRARKDALVRSRLACAKRKGFDYCDSCKEWPCELCSNVPLKSEPQVPP